MSGTERTQTNNKDGTVTITTKYMIKKDGASVAVVSEIGLSHTAADLWPGAHWILGYAATGDRWIKSRVWFQNRSRRRSVISAALRSSALTAASGSTST